MTEGTAETGAATGGVNILLRLEGLTLFVGMVMLYWTWPGSENLAAGPGCPGRPIQACSRLTIRRRMLREPSRYGGGHYALAQASPMSATVVPLPPNSSSETTDFLRRMASMVSGRNGEM